MQLVIRILQGWSYPPNSATETNIKATSFYFTLFYDLARQIEAAYWSGSRQIS